MKKIFYSQVGIFLIVSSTLSIAQPTISFTPNVFSGCVPLTVNFTNTSSSGVSYVWDFGDSTLTDSTVNASHVFTTTGEFTITLSGYNGGGNLIGQQEEIIFVKGSSGFFNSSTDTACPNEFVNFSSGDAASAYLWDFGDGIGVNGNYVVHAFSTSGTYPVSLILNTICGTDTLSQLIVVDSSAIPPLPVFAMSPNPACPLENVQFTYDGTVPLQNWNFGDGNVSTQHSPIYNYNAGGNFLVTLKVTNICGNSNQSEDSIFIDSTLVPDVPFFWFSPDSVCPGDEIFFNVQGDEEFYFWNFGDGDTSTEKYTSHIYDSAGSFIVSLIATNRCENTNNYSDTLVIDSSSAPSIPYFGANTNPTCPGDTVQFNFWENAAGYQWDFGDGSTSVEQSPAHVFQNGGNYQVTLTVTNNCGNSRSFTQSIMVDSSAFPEEPFFWIEQNPACPGDEIQFDYWENVNSYNWNFGDGDFSTNQHTSHIFDTIGNFAVTLTITNSCGNSNSYTAQILVSASNVPVEGGFAWEEPTSGNYAPCENISFSAFGGLSYQWNFGDGDTSSLKEPIHQYDSSGAFEVNVIITNGCGNSDTIFKEITIIGSCNDTLSISEYKPLTLIKVYPNPNNGKFEVQIPDKYRFTDYELTIFNVLGEVVYAENGRRFATANPSFGGKTEDGGQKANANSIDITEQPNGIYFLRIFSDHSNQTIKLVVEN